MSSDDLVEAVATGAELTGAVVLGVGGALVLLRHGLSLARGQTSEAGYRRLRSELGRVLLVGLEVLIVADVLETIVVEPTVQAVALLGALVAIRSVLSLSIDVEIDGRLPWRRA